jgi:hypothetical protein
MMSTLTTALPCNDCTEEDDVNKPPFDLGALSISFSGCGFLGVYHIGVVAALRSRFLLNLHSGRKNVFFFNS